MSHSQSRVQSGIFDIVLFDKQLKPKHYSKQMKIMKND